MKIILLALALTVAFSSAAQDDTEWKEPSKSSQAYRKVRVRITNPPYGLAKVLELIKKIKNKDDESEMGGTSELTTKEYGSLSLREKFTYHVIHGETYSQNCDAYPAIQDEDKKIFGHLPDLFGESGWGDRQKKFFVENSDSVVKLIKESVLRSKHMGLNYKHVILEMNALDIIPFLVSTYNDNGRKDRDILTVMLLLMEENKYQPFIESASRQKLYGKEGDYGYYFNFIVLNKANEDLIIQRATDFYKGWRKM